MKRPWLACPLVGVALLLSGCGDEERSNRGASAQTGATSPRAPTPEGAAVATIPIGETEYRLDPAAPRVNRAGVVRFRVRNDGKAAHALEVEGPKGEVETESIAPGKSATLRADLSEPGAYTMYCPIGNHRELGMEGLVTVAGGGSTSTQEDRTSTAEGRTSGEDDRGRGRGRGRGGDDRSGGAAAPPSDGHGGY